MYVSGLQVFSGCSGTSFSILLRIFLCLFFVLLSLLVFFLFLFFLLLLLVLLLLHGDEGWLAQSVGIPPFARRVGQKSGLRKCLRHFMVTVADSTRGLCGPPVEAFDVGLSAGHEQHAARGKAPCIRVHLRNHPLHRAVAKSVA
jgi:hypothetical protein